MHRRTVLQSLGAFFAGASVMTAGAARAQAPADAASVIESWEGKTAKEAAKAMLDKYGEPDGVTDRMLVWHENGPWLRTIVYREEVDHDFPMPHKDVLEQFVPYDAPPDKFDELAQYDGSVIVERTKGEISARCDKEGANFLALNLADDIVQGKRSVEEARQFYADTIKAFMDGEKPEYMQGLQFEPPSQQAARDADKALIQKKG